MNKIFQISGYIFIVALLIIGCKKPQYSFGDIKSPANLVLNATVLGTNTANPNGDGSGKVNIGATSDNALTYKIDFGDGNSQMVPSGSYTYKYSTPGVYEYVITANAIGTGGSISSVSKKVKVFVDFVIPENIIKGLTGGSSRVWVTDKEAPGHFGVGPADGFSPSWYAASPNSREACAYDDEITFTKEATGRISMTVDNKGQSFSIGAATAFYGQAGGDNCYTLSTGGIKLLSFMSATSASTADVSTRVQFVVPGNGIINFGTGGTTYEILSISDTGLFLRNIGIDGNAWYQKLKAK